MTDLGRRHSVDQEALIEALVAVATSWRDPQHPRRAEAMARTLDAPNRYTEEAIAFALNQQMHEVTPDTLRAWVAGRTVHRPRLVGVWHDGAVPIMAFRDFLAVALLGHRFLGYLPAASPFLLPAFVEELQAHRPALSASFTSDETAFNRAEAMVGSVDDEHEQPVAALCESAGIAPKRRLLRRKTYAVAVIDGHETEEERDGLAEDALLHEGLSGRNVAIIWAPLDLAPDALLQSFAAFRGVFPVHPDTPGVLRMQQAFLEARNQPHAYGDGLEFLMSKGAPERQGPGHVRWVAYHTIDDVITWLVQHDEVGQKVVARPHLANRFPDAIRVVAPGFMHRPALGEDDGVVDTIDFLCSL